MKDYANSILADVPSGNEFIFHRNGQVRKAKNLIDLRVELENISKEEFDHHVNSEKNDFSNWVLNAIGDDKLSKDLLNAGTLEEMVHLIKSRINFAVEIIEKENKHLIKNELKKLNEISEKIDLSFVTNRIKDIKKDISKISDNMKLEQKIINVEDDMEIVPWHHVQNVPINARIIEFLFGFIIGLMGGMILARVIFFI